MCGWKMNFPLGMAYFHGLLRCFGECTPPKFNMEPKDLSGLSMFLLFLSGVYFQVNQPLVFGGVEYRKIAL